LAALLATATLPAAAQVDYRLAFSSYLGGSQTEQIRDVAIDGQGNVYLGGGTASADFPTTPGAWDRSYNGGTFDAFVAKLDPAGNLLWSTFLGGPNHDRVYGLEVDAQGNVYVAGRAGDGFPTTPGTVQPAFNGDVNPSSAYGRQDGFVAKIAADGSRLIWSTYFGSDDREVVRDLAVDGSGNVILGVTKLSRPHPHIANAFQPNLRGPYDGVIAKLSPNAGSVVFASYFGGSGTDGDTPSVRVDAAGNIYYLTHTDSDDAPATPGAWRTFRAGGTDLILSKISPAGALLWSSYFGGSANEFTETHGLAVDAGGRAYIAATTRSRDVPTTAGAFQPTYGGDGGAGTGSQTNYNGDGVIARLSADGSTLLACSYLGGSVGDGIEGAAVDGSGQLYVGGSTFSSDFPVTPGTLQAQRAGDADLFVARLSPDLRQRVWVSFLGGSQLDYGRALGVASDGSVAVGGLSLSSDWPIAAPWQPTKAAGQDTVFALLTLSGGCEELDADGDGQINGIELSWIGRAFGSCRTDPAIPEWWDPVDYDEDGCVDGNDLAILSRDTVWGLSVAECSYP
jgi:hypothetical protein